MYKHRNEHLNNNKSVETYGHKSILREVYHRYDERNKFGEVYDLQLFEYTIDDLMWILAIVILRIEFEILIINKEIYE